MLDVASTIAEIDCERQRGEQLRGRLQAVLDRRARHFGLAAIMLGASTAVLTGALPLTALAGSHYATGIGGGVAEAGIGLAAMFDDAVGGLTTSRNLLAEVWQGAEQPTLVPRSVWRYLTQVDLDGSSRLARLHAAWRTPELLGEPDSETERENIALFFGTEGRFTPSDLATREAMLDSLKASVALMNRDLRALLIETAALR